MMSFSPCITKVLVKQFENSLTKSIRERAPSEQSADRGVIFLTSETICSSTKRQPETVNRAKSFIMRFDRVACRYMEENFLPKKLARCAGQIGTIGTSTRTVRLAAEAKCDFRAILPPSECARTFIFPILRSTARQKLEINVL